MEHQLHEIREQQRASWNKFSPGWKKWDDLTMDFIKPMGNEIIRQLKLKEGAMVLDVASGTGEPGLTIASKLQGGIVMLTDLSEDMLKIAKDHASKKGIANVEFKVCDVCELPFPDDTFDAISCRFGFMFFPDMLLAAEEMFRVLKPGGRVSTAVWNGPEKNFWVTAIGGTINRNLQLPAPSKEVPGMFRCSKSGLLQDILQKAGFKKTSEKEVVGKLHCGTAEVYWSMMTEIAAPFVAALGKADEAMQQKIKDEVLEIVHNKYPDGIVAIDSSALVVFGEK
ncbi:MAG: class I SAM-dependent methyltransferase [Flavobacteriaceae bacterium]